jgi:hypothetical protein
LTSLHAARTRAATAIDQGVTVIVVLEGVQLLVSLDSATVFGPSAHAIRK